MNGIRINMVPIGSVPISPGDMVIVIISTTPPGQGSTSATVFFTNITNGASTSVSVSALQGQKLVGDSAEWIVEEPMPIMGGDTLPDYGEVFFADCEACLAGGGSILSGTGATLDIVAGHPSGVVSRGHLVSPSIVQCSYVGPEP